MYFCCFYIELLDNVVFRIKVLDILNISCKEIVVVLYTKHVKMIFSIALAHQNFSCFCFFLKWIYLLWYVDSTLLLIFLL